MVIREGNHCLEIEAIDRVTQESPSDGDVEFSVAVSSHGFTGHGFGWVDFDSLASFVRQLTDLERKRNGAAELKGISLLQPAEEFGLRPAEAFRLRIWSVDRWGHMAVAGSVARVIYAGDIPLYPHAVEFGFEFDPTMLRAVLDSFRALIDVEPKAIGDV